MRTSRIIGIVALLGWSWAVRAAEPTGVDLSQLAGWDIVLAEDATPAERYAAEEFQAILKQATGDYLPITASPARPDRHVFIGPGQAMRSSPAGFAVDGMGPEDLRIVVRDGLIAIAGGRPRGTLYGVYTFLEDYLDVRFLTADHTHVPRLAGSRRIGPIDRAYHPPLSFRWSYYGENTRDPAFAARIRVNTVSDDPRLGGKTGQSLIGHSFGAQIPTAKYGQEHPEYFALREGKRLNSGDDWSQSEPCLTHPDVLKIVTAAVLEDLKKNPHRENISVSQNDNAQNCLCPNCKAIDDREGTPMGSLLTFVNAVADAVAKEYPHVKVGTLSYWYTRKPPKTLKPRPNVQIQLCSIECCIVHPINDPACEKNTRFCEDMAEWRKLTDQIFIWNYNTNFSNYLLPFPNLRVIEPNVRYFVEQGAKGVFMQAAGNNTGAELSDLRNYMMAGLLWDPTRSGEKLMNEFLDLHYGPSAPPIRKFINEFHDQVRAKGIHRNCFGNAAAYGIDEAVAESALAAFAEAMKLAPDDAVRSRVEKASICAHRAAIEPAWQQPADKPLEEAVAAKTRPHVKRLFELLAKYKVPMFAETTSVDTARQKLRKTFGLKDGEEF
ncbi:MAG: hypothetical protein AMXMBFR83_10830 [Phycisphaerae bacterium]